MDWIADFLIRPPRTDYELNSLPVTVDVGRATYTKIDFEAINPRYLKLQCSLYVPEKPGLSPLSPGSSPNCSPPSSRHHSTGGNKLFVSSSSSISPSMSPKMTNKGVVEMDQSPPSFKGDFMDSSDKRLSADGVELNVSTKGKERKGQKAGLDPDSDDGFLHPPPGRPSGRSSSVSKCVKDADRVPKRGSEALSTHTDPPSVPGQQESSESPVSVLKSSKRYQQIQEEGTAHRRIMSSDETSFSMIDLKSKAKGKSTSSLDNQRKKYNNDSMNSSPIQHEEEEPMEDKNTTTTYMERAKTDYLVMPDISRPISNPDVKRMSEPDLHDMKNRSDHDKPERSTSPPKLGKSPVKSTPKKIAKHRSQKSENRWPGGLMSSLPEMSSISTNISRLQPRKSFSSSPATSRPTTPQRQPSERIIQNLRIPKKRDNQTCLLYLHGNSGNRLDALSCFNMIALYKLSLCCFDFSGCGRSEGKYISLGWHEKEDIKVVIEYLRQWEGFSSFILWGRSMGAVAALLYVNYYYEEAKEVVNGIILDSPFCSLKRVAEEVFQQFHGSTILNPLFHVSFSSLNKIVKKKASFDIKDLEISNNLLELDIPCLFVHGSEDKFVVPQHSQILFDCYKGRKKYVLVKGDHNSSRGVDFWEDVSYFMYESLKDKSLRKPFSIFGPKEHAIGASKFYCQYRKMKRDLAKKQDEREPFDNGDLTKKPVHVVVVIDSKEVRSIEPFLGITNWVFPLESIKGVIVEDAFGIVFEEETYLLITPEPEKIRESILINKSIHKKEKFKHQDDILIIVDNLTRKMFSSSINNKTEINIPELTRSVISTLEPFIFGTELTNEQLEIEVKNLIYKLMEDSL